LSQATIGRLSSSAKKRASVAAQFDLATSDGCLQIISYDH
jgi:hypothetical protein